MKTESVSVSDLPAPGTIVTDTATLASACAYMRDAEFIAVDTEFHRESTYWPKLCLVQLATPETDILMDPLESGLDLAPFLALLAEPGLTKVMHGARQDMEIFLRLTGAVPVSVFDTQIAAMACGLGDFISYDGLIRQLLKERVDKAQQMADWTRRPMQAAQLRYARADVTLLARAYPILRKRLESLDRGEWIAEEMAILHHPDTYSSDPKDAWRRMKRRKSDAGYLAVLAAVACWREQRAQDEDRPRQWVLRDEAVYAIAARRPETLDDLRTLRNNVGRKFTDSRKAEQLLAVVKAARNAPPPDDVSSPAPRRVAPAGLTELLRCLLKKVAADLGVAPRLIADSTEIERIACGDRSTRAMSGWRSREFGAPASDLCAGRLFLGARADGSVTTTSFRRAPAEESSLSETRPD